MVMVVADAILEPRWRAGWLDTADETFGDEQTKRVVHRLQRDRPDLSSDGFGHGVRRDVRLIRDDPENGQTLRRYLNPALT
jgi:hypothetical protein